MSKTLSAKPQRHSVENKKLTQNIQIKILFQRNLNPKSILTMILSVHDMNQLDIKVGSKVLAVTDSSNVIMFEVWPSKSLPCNTAIVSKLLQSNFESDTVTLTKVSPRLRLFPAVKVELQTSKPLTQPLTNDIVASTILAAGFITSNLKFNISWGGSLIPFRVIRIYVDMINPFDEAHYNEHNRSNEEAVVYSVDKNTNIDIQTINFTSTLSVGFIETIASSPFATIRTENEAYATEYNLALKYLRLGLGLEKAILMKSKMVPGDVSDNSNEPPAGNLVINRPRGLLIHGSPGTGKTRFMKLLATHSRYNSFNIGPEILLNRLENGTESTLNTVFRTAKRDAPSCILFDDLDLICPPRGDATAGDVASDAQRKFVSCLLRLVDELNATDARVFLIATTSSPNSIDRAMRRPGRLDKEIELSIPTSAQRVLILTSLLAEMKINTKPSSPSPNDTPKYNAIQIESECIARIGCLAHGMVASDLVSVIKEACILNCDRSNLHHTANTTKVDIKLDRFNDFAVRDLADDFSTVGLAPSASPDFEEQQILSSSSAGFMTVTEADLLRAVDRITPSAIREIVLEIPTVRWSDIGGMDSVKQSLKEVVEWPLQYPELFRTLNVSPPKGVLLYGPPGCSKTLMAKALATESSMNFLAVRGPELLSKWLGESEKAVQKLFHRARAVSPCIVFFDEIDAFASKRGSSSTGVNDRVLSQLLAELDGVQGSTQVTVVAATNRPDLLDVALLRPGRIDRKIYVPPPDAGSREQILRIQLRKMPCLFDVESVIHSLVEKTERFSGAEVVSVCQEAAMLSIDEHLNGVALVNIHDAIEKTSPQITDVMITFYTELQRTYQM